MTDKEWDQIQEVHLKGSFSCSRAAWPIFVKQKFGRIVNTASAAGIYGTLKESTGMRTFSGCRREFWSSKLQRRQDGSHCVHQDACAGRC